MKISYSFAPVLVSLLAEISKKIDTEIIFSLLDKLFNDKVASSEDLGEDLNITISRVNHHIRNFNDSSLLYRKKRLLYLRVAA
jgi:predicted transcriptional regulator